MALPRTKYRKLSRTFMMDVAKIVRNEAIAKTGKISLARKLANYFAVQDQFFDRTTFMQIAVGDLDVDPKTEAYTLLKDM